MNPETWAVSKSDLFIKEPTGRDADNIAFGSTLSNDRHAGRPFDYLIANPPYGKDWKRDEEAVRDEHARGETGRFAPGLPRISDGQLLFLLHMLAHRKEPKEGGSRIAIIMNGSPLFTGDAGSGESEIRRWILENDLARSAHRAARAAFLQHRHRHLCVGANEPQSPRAQGQGAADRRVLRPGLRVSNPMRKSLGDKRREIPVERAQDILKILADFKDGDTRRVKKDGKEEEIVVSRIYPDDSFRLPQDHGRTAAPAQFPSVARAIGAARRGARIPSTRTVEKEGCSREQRKRPKDESSRKRSEVLRTLPGHALQGPRRIRARCWRRQRRRPTSSFRPGRKGDSLGAFRAG